MSIYNSLRRFGLRERTLEPEIGKLGRMADARGNAANRSRTMANSIDYGEDSPERLQAVRERIASRAAPAGRPIRARSGWWRSSKTFPPQMFALPSPQASGHFGENYVQEGARQDGAARATCRIGVAFHRSDPEQQDQADRRALSAWVHGIDRLKIAERLSAQRPADLPPLELHAGQRERRSDQERGRPADIARSLAAGRGTCRGCICAVSWRSPNAD